jgi:intein/homing endonuclease/superfamily II DNA or RNA helicase
MIDMKFLPSAMRVEVKFEKYLPTLVKRIARIEGSKYDPDTKKWNFPIGRFMEFYSNVCDEFLVKLSPALKKIKTNHSPVGDAPFPHPLIDLDGIFNEGVELEVHQHEGLSMAAYWYEQEGKGCIIGLGPGGGKCQPHGAPILLADGTMATLGGLFDTHDDGSFEGGEKWINLAEPLFVPSLNESLGRFEKKRVSRLYKQQVNENLNALSLSNGAEVVLTDIHPMLKVDFSCGAPCWVSSCDLQEGDYVAVPRTLPEPDFATAKDVDLVRLVAWQIAEGHERFAKGAYALRITQKDDALTSMIEGFAGAAGISTRASRDAKGLNVISVLDCKNYAEMLSHELGYQWGSKSAQKRIPDGVLSLPNSQASEFLRHFFEAEGSCSERGVEITTASRHVASSLCYLLKRFGIHVTIDHRMSQATNSAKPTRRHYIRLKISGDALRAFFAHIGFVSDRKNAILMRLAEREANTNVDVVPGANLYLSEICQMLGLAANMVFGPNRINSSCARGQQLSRARTFRAIDAVRSVLNGSLLREREGAIEASVAAGDNWRKTNSFRASANRVRAISVKARQEALRRLEALESFVNGDLMVARIVRKSREFHEFVYDVTVDDHHNYVGGHVPVVMHNTCIGMGYQKFLRRDFPMKHGWRALIVCPASIKLQWLREIEFFIGGTSLIIKGDPKKRAKLWEEAKNPKYDFVICNYEQISSDYAMIPAFPLVIVDEAHRYKNPSAKRSKKAYEYKRLKKVNGDNPLFLELTGTFLVNQRHDGWNLMRLAGWQFGKNFWDFQQKCCHMDDYGTVCGIKLPEAQDYIDQLKQVTYIKTKDELAKTLPPRNAKTIYLEMDTRQKKFYDTLFEGELDVMMKAGENFSTIDVEGVWGRLRQAAVSPETVKAFRKVLNKEKTKAAGKKVYDKIEMEVKAPDESIKFDWLRDFLDDFEEDFLIIYSPFTSALDALQADSRFKNEAWVRIDGSVNPEKRQGIIDAAKTAGKGYFLITDALQEGANLQFCSDTIFLTPPLTHAAREQIEARTWRKGQKKTSNFYYPIVENTIEVKVMKMIDAKKDLMSGLKGGVNELRELMSA